MINNITQTRIDIVIQSVRLYTDYIDSQTDIKLIANFQKKLDIELQRLDNFKSKYPEYFI